MFLPHRRPKNQDFCLRNFILLIDILIQGEILHNYSYSSGVQFAKCSFLMSVFFFSYHFQGAEKVVALSNIEKVRYV